MSARSGCALFVALISARVVAGDCTPVEVGVLPLSGILSGVDEANGLLAMPMGSTGFAFGRVAETGAPELLGWVDTPGAAVNAAIANGFVAVADGDGGLAIVDTADMVEPEVRSSTATADFAAAVAVSGTRAFVAAKEAGFLVYDVSNLDAPVLRASRPTAGWARGVFLDGTLAYVTVWQTGLEIFDVANPDAPTLLGSYDTADRAVTSFVADGVAYVADRYGGMVVLDVLNPAAPALLAIAPTPDQVTSVRVIDDVAFVTDLAAGLVIFDVSDPAAPREIGRFETPGSTYATDWDGRRLFVADWDGGLRVLDVSGCLASPPVAAFDWWPPMPRAGEEVAFHDRSSGDPTSWRWSFGDGSESSLADPLHVFARAGAYDVSLTVTNAGGSSIVTSRVEIACADASPPPCMTTYWLPGVARTAGAAGTEWRSDLVVYDVAGGGLATIGFRPFDGGAWVGGAGPSLAAGTTRTFEDVLLEIFGIDDGAGVLRVEAPLGLEPLLRLETYDLAGDGRYGQKIAPVRDDDPSLDEPKRTLPGIGWDDEIRTNLGVLNLAAEPLEVDVRLVPGGAAVRLALPPEGATQRNLATILGALEPFQGAVEVDRVAGGRFLVWASRVDNRSGDPVFIPDRTEANGRFFVPGVASTAGSAGTRWRTRMTLVARGVGELALEFRAATGESHEATLSLAVDEPRDVGDVLEQLFAAGDSWGAIEAEWSGTEPLRLWASTWNDDPTGSYGQTILPVPEENLLAAGKQARLYGLAHTDELRTNLGIVSRGAATLVVELRVSTGSLLASHTLVLGAESWQRELFDWLEVLGPIVDASLVVRHVSGDDVLVYASRIDGVTGDPIFLHGE